MTLPGSGSGTRSGAGAGTAAGVPPDEPAFRREFRAWLAQHLPFPALPLDDAARHDLLGRWQRTLYDAGWMGVSFPHEYGGRAMSLVHEAIVNDELGSAGAPSPFVYGYVARVLLERGTAEQRARYLRPALRGDERWCQGFSEPDAGSDLAAVRTRAVADGDGFLITGQKVWTSRAHFADWCFLLARTGEPAGRHHGLSCFIVETDAPGVRIRPFRQMTGGLEFAEVFLDEVRVGGDRLVGGLGQGWDVALSTVAYERGPADVGRIAELRRRIRRLAAVLRSRQLQPADELVRRLTNLYVDTEVLSRHVLRGLRDREAGAGEMVGTSVDKLLVTGIDQGLASLELDVHGASALTGEAPAVLWGYLDARAASIYGGSSQVQRNIIAQRVLGLPRA